MPPKGKQGTKGQKQIFEENQSTLNFYLYIILGSNATHFGMQYLFFWESFTIFYMMLSSFTFVALVCFHKFMGYMARCRRDAISGALLDAGTDLNMEHGLAEHLKDLILITSIVQVLALISNYFWLLLLLAPGYAFYLLWVNILAPWIFAEPPEEDEKKARKLDKKMRRR